MKYVKNLPGKNMLSSVHGGGHRSTIGKLIWRLLILEKSKIFGWLCSHDKILTAENLVKKGLTSLKQCLLCGSAKETIHHLMVGCGYSKLLWNPLLTALKLQPLSNSCQALWIQWAQKSPASIGFFFLIEREG